MDDTVLPLAILASGQLFNAVFGSVGLFLSMLGYERQTLFGQLIALVVTVSLAVIIVPDYGAIGAATAVSSGLITWNLVLGISLKKCLGVNPTVIG